VWHHGEFDCFNVKDCGLVPCCIPDYFAFPCILGSALSQIKGYKEEGQCAKCCVMATCCPFCVLCCERGSVSRHYGIVSGTCSDCCWTYCCPLCVYYQLVNEVMVREKLTWGICELKSSTV